MTDKELSPLEQYAAMDDEQKQRCREYFFKHSRDRTILDFYGEDYLNTIVDDIRHQLEGMSLYELLGGEEPLQTLINWTFNTEGREDTKFMEIEAPLFLFFIDSKFKEKILEDSKTGNPDKGSPDASAD